jgi:hypothetical protein
MRSRPGILIAATLAASYFGGQISPALSQPGPQSQNPAFKRVWERTDSLVLNGKVQRTWLWGPGPLTTLKEPLAESPDGMREVQYYPKARMEINNPAVDPSSPWYVTNGLLVYEMISGRIQVSANRFLTREPVAGDTISTSTGNDSPPSYRALRHVATLVPGGNVALSKLKQKVNEHLLADGSVVPLEVGFADRAKIALPQIAYHDTVTGHNIPDVFWEYLNQSGPVYENGRLAEARLFDWIYAFGHPVTEPYWITAVVQGKTTKVMMQAFQRRILTYNFENPPGWKVEMGNVGSHYYSWRYENSPGGGEEARNLTIRRVMFVAGQDARPQPIYAVHNSESEWRHFWEYFTLFTPSLSSVPQVDFSRELAIIVSLGTKNLSARPTPIIQSIVVQGKEITVKTITEIPGSVFHMSVSPFEVVAVPQSELSPGTYTVLFVSTDDESLSRTEIILP